MCHLHRLLFGAILFAYVGIIASEESLVAQMSTEELVGQLLLVNVFGTTPEEIIPLIDECRLGGIILFPWANGLKQAEHIRSLIRDLQQHVASQWPSIPLCIAIDREGGRVTRLRGEDFLKIPSQLAVNNVNDTAYTEFVHTMLAYELASLGITMNCAPVIDVRSVDSPIVGDRSFSTDPEVVSRQACAALVGYDRSGMIVPVVKHFPGHGGVVEDSHVALPVLRKTRAEMDACELVPFRATLDAAPAVMTAHIMVPELDERWCASLSPQIVSGLLRDEFGYQGVIVTDSLTMAGAAQQAHSIGDVAVQALRAGSDMLCVCDVTCNADVVRSVYGALCHAVASGVISRERLELSVRRILQLKERSARVVTMNLDEQRMLHQWVKKTWAQVHEIRVQNPQYQPLDVALMRLMRAYPDHIAEATATYVRWVDGEIMPLYEPERSDEQYHRFDNPTLYDQVCHDVYDVRESGAPQGNPGRVRYMPFFCKLYGATQGSVERKLDVVRWDENDELPMTSVCGVSDKVRAIVREVSAYRMNHPEHAPLLTNLGGSYCWRCIAGSSRMSAHSFGIAVDLNPNESEYWRWDLERAGESASEESVVMYRNRVPQEIVEIFEKYGFIWGGRWYNYDTMHFEYRPELFGARCSEGSSDISGK